MPANVQTIINEMRELLTQAEAENAQDNIAAARESIAQAFTVFEANSRTLRYESNPRQHGDWSQLHRQMTDFRAALPPLPELVLPTIIDEPSVADDLRPRDNNSFNFIDTLALNGALLSLNIFIAKLPSQSVKQQAIARAATALSQELNRIKTRHLAGESSVADYKSACQDAVDDAEDAGIITQNPSLWAAALNCVKNMINAVVRFISRGYSQGFFTIPKTDGEKALITLRKELSFNEDASGEVVEQESPLPPI